MNEDESLLYVILRAIVDTAKPSVMIMALSITPHSIRFDIYSTNKQAQCFRKLYKA